MTAAMIANGVARQKSPVTVGKQRDIQPIECLNVLYVGQKWDVRVSEGRDTRW